MALNLPAFIPIRRLLVVVGICGTLMACLPLATPTPAPTHPPTRLLPTAAPMEMPVSPDALSLAPRYAISLTVDVAHARVAGEQVVHYTNAEEVPLRDLYFFLFPNTPGHGGEMRVSALCLNGEPVSPEVRLGGSALRLLLNPPLAPRETVTLSLAFTATVPLTDGIDYAQFSYVRGVMALPQVYPLIPVYDHEGWNVKVAPGYGDAVYSDVAFYQVEVTAPPTMTLVASGTCAVREAGRWSCQAGPVRDFVLILGRETTCPPDCQSPPTPGTSTARWCTGRALSTSMPCAGGWEMRPSLPFCGRITAATATASPPRSPFWRR